MKNIALFLPVSVSLFSAGTFSGSAVSLIIVFLTGIGLAVAMIRIRVLKNQKSELERYIVERNELLAFAAEREKKAQDALIHLNQANQNLLSRINHDTRTPMNGVIGMATLLAETSLTIEQRDYTETIRKCGENLLTIINDILPGNVPAPHKFELEQPRDEYEIVKDQIPLPKLSIDFSQQYPLRILVAEDDRVNQKLAMKVLSKLGYSPDIAEDGNEVLEMVSNTSYDLVLMDVKMPEMDGLQATRMIRLCLAVQPVIIAMTANSMESDREECLQAGMDDYISKPVHLEELVSLLEKWALTIKEHSVVNQTPLHLLTKLP